MGVQTLQILWKSRKGYGRLYCRFSSNLSKNFSFGGPTPLSLHRWGWNLAWRREPSAPSSSMPLGWPKTLRVFLSVCLFVCLFVCPSRFWTSEFVRPISPWRRWSTETILMLLDRRTFVVVHLCSTFWDWYQLATSLNAKVQKNVKIVFFASKGRQNKPIETKFRR